jgi:hypothetical protein
MFKYGITNPKDIHLKNNLIDITEATLNVIIRKRVVPRLKLALLLLKNESSSSEQSLDLVIA